MEGSVAALRLGAGRNIFVTVEASHEEVVRKFAYPLHSISLAPCGYFGFHVEFVSHDKWRAGINTEPGSADTDDCPLEMSPLPVLEDTIEGPLKQSTRLTPFLSS